MKVTQLLTTGLLVLVSMGVAAHAAEGEASPTMALFDAVNTGNVGEVKLHIAAKTDLNAPDPRGRRPLAAAVVAQNMEIITLLTEAGADPKLRCRYGVPILMAAQTGQLEVVKLFVTKAGVDVNGRFDGVTPLTAAQRQPEVQAWLKEQGAVEQAFTELDPYGTRGLDGQAGPQSPGTFPGQTPTMSQPQVLADPNAIRAQIKAVPGLEAALAAIDANSTVEMRSWRQRNLDNRTSLLRSVEKQFNEEMALAKETATKEASDGKGLLGALASALQKKPKDQPAAEQVDPTANGPAQVVAAIDALVAKRTQRYEVLSDELRTQRRAALQENRDQAVTARGTRGRGSSRGRSSARQANPAYPAAPVRPDRTARDADATPLDPVTEEQLRAWLGANPQDKRDLLNAVHQLDLQEYGALHQLAVEKKAPATATALAGLMLARQDRLQETFEKMAADDERLQRLESRTGGDLLQPNGATPMRGRRSR